MSLEDLSRELPAAQLLGVVIGSAMANHSIVCASLPRNATVRCPCCWVAPVEMATMTTRCAVWNPNL